MRYSIVEIGKRSGRLFAARIVMPPISARLSTEQQYERELLKMLRAIAAEVKTFILPIYAAEIRAVRDIDDNIFSRLRGIAAALAAQSSAMANRILQLEAERHTETFMATAKKALGIDIGAVVSQEDLREYLQQAAARNTSLITSLAADVVKNVEQTVLQNLIAGKPGSVLRKELQTRFGVGASRARLIARDQTAKLNSDLNRIRQEQAGIEAYEWSTSNDERVRPLHQAIDGKEYEWGKPTGAEGGLPPGQPIQCRCVARAIVEFGPRKIKAPSIEPELTVETFKDVPKRTLDEYYSEAPALQIKMDEAARKAGDGYKTPGIKKQETAAEKIIRKGYDGPSGLTDIIRGGFTVKTPGEADKIIAKLAKDFTIMDEGWNTTPAGYFDRKALVRFDNGMIGELQFWEPNVLAAKKEKGHKLYEVQRMLKPGSIEAEKLNAEMRALYLDARSKAGQAWSNIGTSDKPKLLKRSRQADSSITPPVS